MKQHLSHPFLIVFIAMFALILLHACEDSTSVQDIPPKTDNQTPGAIQQTSPATQQADSAGIIEGEYIVIFENQFNNVISEQVARQADQLREDILSAHSISQDSVHSRYRYAIKGFSAKLSDAQVEVLKNDPHIARVSPNVMLRLGIAPDKTGVSTSRLVKTESPVPNARNALAGGQTFPWGVLRVDGPLDGTGTTAWILDTGIDLDHPDLNVDVNNSASFIASESADDGNGHGTYVAGIIAAIDNNQGAVGVAEGATVVAVRVCFDEADPGEDQCPADRIIAGVDYVAPRAQPEDVVNISIWGSTTQALIDLENTILNAADNGIRFTLIAGNAGADANNFSPGRINHTNVWTMSAFDDTDTFASFSNFGNPPIDYSGPGVDVPSLQIGGGAGMGFGPSGSEDGTSYAAPHIAGLLLASVAGPALMPTAQSAMTPTVILTKLP